MGNALGQEVTDGLLWTCRYHEVILLKGGTLLGRLCLSRRRIAIRDSKSDKHSEEGSSLLLGSAVIGSSVIGRHREHGCLDPTLMITKHWLLNIKYTI